MIITHVRKIIVTVLLDALILISIVMTMMPVPEILVVLRMVANMIVFHAMITMLVPQMTVIEK
jgi:hypothetical protein